jgi:hypothetical protein
MFEVLLKNDIQYWADRFLNELQQEPETIGSLEQMQSGGTP